MKIWRLTINQYIKLNNKFKANRRLDGDEFGSAVYTDLVLGTGTQYVDEYLNPKKLPIFIDYHTKFGTVRFVRK